MMVIHLLAYHVIVAVILVFVEKIIVVPLVKNKNRIEFWTLVSPVLVILIIMKI